MTALPESAFSQYLTEYLRHGRTYSVNSPFRQADNGEGRGKFSANKDWTYQNLVGVKEHNVETEHVGIRKR